LQRLADQALTGSKAVDAVGISHDSMVAHPDQKRSAGCPTDRNMF
jgi:hypothetical protein